MNDVVHCVVVSGVYGLMHSLLQYVIVALVHALTSDYMVQVIVGATVIRVPNYTLAPSALTELELAVDVFKRGANHSLRARQGLVRPISNLTLWKS